MEQEVTKLKQEGTKLKQAALLPYYQLCNWILKQISKALAKHGA